MKYSYLGWTLILVGASELAKGMQLSHASALPPSAQTCLKGGKIPGWGSLLKGKKHAELLGLSLVSTVSWPSYRTAKAGKASSGLIPGLRPHPTQVN